MSLFHSNSLIGASGQGGGGGGGYSIARSVRFEAAASSNLSRTFGTATNKRIFTWSSWVKLGILDSNFRALIEGFTGGNDVYTTIAYNNAKFTVASDITYIFGVSTDAVFRDPSAWYHLVVVFDTTQSTSTNRIKIYVNGVQQTLSGTFPTQNTDTWLNNTNSHRIGSRWTAPTTTQSFDGYLADINFVDGQALTPSSFGETDTNGVWQPIEYTGTYGTNGFHLPFSDNSTAAALGTDTSGNGNTWTVNNLTANSLYSSAGFLNPQNAFDGNTGTSAEVSVAAGLGTIVFTSGISVSSSITIKYGSGTSGNIFINGSATAMQATGTQTQTINFSGTLNTLGLQSGSQPVLYYVQIDGGSYLTGANAVNNDSLVDTPTNGSQTDTGVGGEVVGNYATLNPLDKASATTLANGNLDYSTSGAGGVRSTIGMVSGKYYAEVTVGNASLTLGIATGGTALDSYLGANSGEYGYGQNGYKLSTAGQFPYGSTFTTGDVIGIAFDADIGSLYFYKNGTIQNSGTAAFTGLTSGPYFFAISNNVATSTCNANFGQRPFAYTAPSGFKALCTTNLPTPTIADGSTVMDVKLYTGNGSTQTISGLGFSPDLVWVKTRSGAGYHILVDQVRGAGKILSSNDNIAEANNSDTNTAFQAFTSDGFTVGANASWYTNNLNVTHAAWCWDAGSSTVSNTDGSITSTVRANSSAGFSIVTWTGTGSNGATVGHGLGVAPSFVIIKQRIAGPGTDLYNWNSYHSSLGATKYIALNTTDAAGTGPLFNDTAPTSTVFSLGSSTGSWNSVNDASGVTYVAYCFAPVAGYSAFGSYTGNGSATDGPFVYTGFKVKFLLVKCTSTASTRWLMLDAARLPYNGPNMPTLYANLADAESTNAENAGDFLSNGFKVRYNNGNWNGSGQTYLFAAFSENPFRTTRAR